MKRKNYLVMLLAVMMLLANAVPAFAATSKYGEDQPLKAISTVCYPVDKDDSHQHWYIDADNRCRYLLYDACMDGMIGSTPTNHLPKVTIDGVAYSLCNYGYENSSIRYANVIRRLDGKDSANAAAGKKPIALKNISLDQTSVKLNVGGTVSLKVSFTPSNTTVSRTVQWSSANNKIATVSKGKVTAKAPGTTTITVKAGSKTAKCTVTVKAPLKSISLGKTSISLTVGKSQKLAVSYLPSNTTSDKTVVWSSSNPKVASVSAGKVTAKKAGEATITAKVGSKKATCRVVVKTAKTTSKNDMDVADVYSILNAFRTTKSNQWYWDETDSRKIRTYGLKGIKRDEALEKTARLRAKEQWIMFYERGERTHDRPDGSQCFTAYPKDCGSRGECLAWGVEDFETVMALWAETNNSYSRQAHRRILLDSIYTRVGIACYKKDGNTCWALCLSA